jgi:hypothetical protein
MLGTDADYFRYLKEAEAAIPTAESETTVAGGNDAKPGE